MRRLDASDPGYFRCMSGFQVVDFIVTFNPAGCLHDGIGLGPQGAQFFGP